MDEANFKLNKSNKIMIGFTAIFVIVLILMIVLLYKTIHTETAQLPTLNTTNGRETTKETTTAAYTTTTKTTTAVPTSSPYYKVDVNSLLSEDYYTNQNPNTEEKKKIAVGLVNIANQLYDTSDYSLFNTDLVLRYSKTEEGEVINKDGHKYALLYNMDSLINKMYVSYRTSYVLDYKYNDIPVIILDNGKYYRLENNITGGHPIFGDVTIVNGPGSSITADVQYYMSDYKESGYSSPVYKFVEISIKYDNNRWGISDYTYPIYS
ncbi:MAG TPA: hypothetical protein PLB45_00575 [Bacilli bacterium]|jgi:hypothetical protein|nr:hypothetical protein [Bacilli bacterium]HPZ23694.1 hypothetical protein [Bacilli bacterium]HQC83354.1 hypothetical protein [Bacilli bacterium]